MIDFRYHLVSIIAVFLSLAVGLVLGTTALNGPVVDALRGQVEGLSGDKRELRAGQERLRRELAADAQLISGVTPALVAGQLAGQQVTLIEAGDVPGDTVEQVTAVLRSAGATVTSRVSLDDDYLTADGERRLGEALKEIGTSAAGLADPSLEAARVLASVLVSGSTGVRGPGTAPAPDPTTVLNALEDAGMLQAGDVAARATTAVLLTSGDQPGTGGDYGSAAVARLAMALDSWSNGVVVAGPAESAESGGVLASLRENRTATRAVSSVDGVDAPAGRLQAVYALAEQLSGRSGSYGIVAGEVAPVRPPAGR